MKETTKKGGGKNPTHNPFPPEARVAWAPIDVLHFYYQVVQWEETGSAVFISDLSPITGAISEQSLLANGNTRRRRLTRPPASTSLCTSGEKKIWLGMGRRILLDLLRVPSAGRLCLQAASEESIKATEGGAHPALCMYGTAPARFFFFNHSAETFSQVASVAKSWSNYVVWM